MGYDSLIANIRYYMGRQDHNLDGYRVTEGMEELSKRMWEEIQEVFDKQGEGKRVEDVVRFDQPITTIHNGSDPVTVITSNGLTISCHKVFLCLPIVPMHNITFDTLS